MKKILVFICFIFVFTGYIYSQTIDRTQYKSIDPFDYVLQSKKAPENSVRKYKSTVKFVVQNGLAFTFFSLNEDTMLMLETTKRFNQMTTGQKVTIYYTAAKKKIDKLTLDDIDYSNTTSTIDTTQNKTEKIPTIDKTKYISIDPFDYELQSQTAPENSVRKYKSTVKFVMQDGVSFTFFSLNDDTMLILEVTRRFNQMKIGQNVTIYYTATKKDLDILILDDIDY